MIALCSISNIHNFLTIYEKENNILWQLEGRNEKIYPAPLSSEKLIEIITSECGMFANDEIFLLSEEEGTPLGYANIKENYEDATDMLNLKLDGIHSIKNIDDINRFVINRTEYKCLYLSFTPFIDDAWLIYDYIK